jgi:hypothetical protein
MDHPISVANIDLRWLAERLRARVGSSIEASYLRGRTVLRDSVAAELRCSDEVAEELIDTLELQGFVRFPQLEDETHPQTRQIWEIGAPDWTR